MTRKTYLKQKRTRTRHPKRKKHQRRKTKKNCKKQRKTYQRREGGMSGIMLKETVDPNSALNTFLRNSSCKFLSKGSFGIALVVSINNPNLSPYESTDAETYGEPVDKLLIKITCVQPEGYTKGVNAELNQYGMQSIPEADFLEETKIQECVYKKTKQYLEPICPAIVYDEVIKSTLSKEAFLDSIELISDDSEKTFASTPNEEEEELMMTTKKLIQDFRRIFNYYDIGIIAMEFAGGYKTAFDLARENPGMTMFYRELVMFIILEMAIKTGYAHLDSHFGNIMINSNSTSYFKKKSTTTTNDTEIKGKPLLIDFGMARKIDDTILDSVRTLYNNYEYTEALHALCHVTRKPTRTTFLGKEYYDYFELFDPLEKYGWICGLDQKYVRSLYNLKKRDIEASYPEILDLKLARRDIKKSSPNYQEQVDDIDRRIHEMKIEIEEKLKKEFRDPKYMKFPPDTNANIRRLVEERRQAELEMVETFNRTHPSGPMLPLPNEDCT
jgi:serine/threonine protein kinase